MKNSRRFKKVASLATAALMAACMAAPMTAIQASAVGGTITISETENNHTYKAYQIFKGEVVTAETTEAGQTPQTSLQGIEWGSGIDSAKYDTIYSEVKDALGLDKAPTSASELASALSNVTDGVATTYGEADKVAAIFAKYVTGDGIASGTGDNAKKISVSEDGYYIVMDSKGSLTGDNDDYKSASKYLLKVVGKDETITVKKDAPELMKKIKENNKYTGIPTFKGTEQTADAGYNDTADYCVGDTVPFKLYGSLPTTLDNYQKGYKYVFHDSLDEQFTLDEDSIVVKVSVDGTEYIVKPAADKTGYVVDKDGDTCTFDIAFADIKSAVLYSINDDGSVGNVAEGIKVKADSVVTVSYDATLNSKAIIGRPGQQNEAYLEYASDSNWTGEGEQTPDQPTEETTKDNVLAFTYELDLTKVDSANVEAKLKDANFALTRTVGDITQYAVLEDATKNGVAVKQVKDWVVPTGDITINAGTGAITANAWTSVYELTYDGGVSAPTIVTSAETTGAFNFAGLDDGTYTVLETKAPTGYKIDTTNGQPFTFVIKADTTNNQDGTGVDEGGTALKYVNLYTDSVADSNLIDPEDASSKESANVDGTVGGIIKNTSSSSLPSTGGMGTTLFYIGGGVLAAGAGVLLITKKRTKKD